MFRDRAPMRDRGPRINERIGVREVRVVGEDGEQLGVLPTREALTRARELGLDLVEVAPKSRPPVCRIMDYGKYKYEQSVRDREARKKQTRTVIKEARLTPRIADHDFQMQARRTAEWLEEGDKVKVTVRFRGRERERPEYGKEVLDRLLGEIDDLGVVEQPATLEGRNMTMTLAPNRRRRHVDATTDTSADEQPETEE